MHLRAFCCAVLSGLALYSSASANAAAGASADASSAPPPAAYCSGFIAGNREVCHFTLRTSGRRTFKFTLINYTRGFDPYFIIQGYRTHYVVNSNGPSRGEVFSLTVPFTFDVKVTIGAVGNRTVGKYKLVVTP